MSLIDVIAIVISLAAALALFLPLGMERDVILTVTYAMVIFSIAVQGLTIGWV